MTPTPTRTASWSIISVPCAFAFSLARNDAQADDLVQEALEKAWENIASVNGGAILGHGSGGMVLSRAA